MSKIQVDSSSTFETVLKRFDKWLKEQVTPEQNFVIATDGLVVNQYLMVGQLSRFLGTVQLESIICLLYTSPSPRDATLSRMPSSA